MYTNRQYVYCDPVCIFSDCIIYLSGHTSFVYFEFLWVWVCARVVCICGIICLCSCRGGMDAHVYARGQRRTLSIFLYHSLLFIILRQGLPLSRKLPIGAGLASQRAPALPDSASQCSGYRFTWPCPTFTWMLGIWTQVLVLTHRTTSQALHTFLLELMFWIWNIYVI